MSRSPSLAAVVAVLAGLAGTVPASTPVRAAELVMVETRGCAWCAKWHREIGPVYAKTAEGRRLPLRRVRLEAMPADLRFLRDLRYAPTFVAVACGREAGRIVGYGGDEMFWGELGQIVARIAPSC